MQEKDLIPIPGTMDVQYRRDTDLLSAMLEDFQAMNRTNPKVMTKAQKQKRNAKNKAARKARKR